MDHGRGATAFRGIAPGAASMETFRMISISECTPCLSTITRSHGHNAISCSFIRLLHQCMCESLRLGRFVDANRVVKGQCENITAFNQLVPGVPLFGRPAEKPVGPTA